MVVLDCARIDGGMPYVVDLLGTVLRAAVTAFLGSKELGCDSVCIDF